MTINGAVSKVGNWFFGGGESTPAKQNQAEPSYWLAGGDRFESLDDLGQAVTRGDLNLPAGGTLRAREMAWQPDQADNCRDGAKIAYAASAAFLGVGLAVAAIPGVGAIALLPIMGTMLSFGIGEGSRKAAHHFDQARQIRQQGDIGVGVHDGKAAVIFQDWDSQKQQPIAVLSD